MAKDKSNGIIRERLVPRWKLVEKRVEVRELDEEFDSEIASIATSFVDRCRTEGKPEPNPAEIAARIRHILRHSRGRESIELLSSPRPPYFGVTTREDEAVQTRRED